MAEFVDIAALLGVVCEAVLYGINAILVFLALTILIPRYRQGGSNRVILVANCILFVSCTAHFALEFDHFYRVLKDIGVDGFANETNVYFAADLFISITDFIGDMILLYRCWIIWGGNYYVVILPFLTSAGGLIAAAEVGHLVVGTTDAEVSPAIIPLGLASFILPLCTNVLVTGLIVGRIWYKSRGMQAYAFTNKRGIINIMIESGGLYFATQFVFVVLYGMSHPGIFIVIPMAVQVYGIASTLIIIHAGLGLSWEYQANQEEGFGRTSWGKILRSHVNNLTTHKDDIEMGSTQKTTVEDVEVHNANATTN